MGGEGVGRVIEAFRGEFGLMVRYHVPVVYAMGPGHVIEIEQGNEALYPLAAEWRVVPRTAEDTPEASRARSGIGRPRLKGPEKRFVPEPHVPQGVSADVVIAPRMRHYGASKNWRHWPLLAEGLTDKGLKVFAGGTRDTSDTRVRCAAAWDHERSLDATIEAIRSARLVIATDAGIAHLAVLCGARLLLLTHRGMVAPGPVVDSSGRTVASDYWPVRMDEYYHAANHMGSPIECAPYAWDDPEAVLDRAAQILGA